MSLVKLRNQVASIGGSVDEEHLHVAIIVDAPAGRIWSANGGHAMRVDHGRGYMKKSEAVADMLDRVSHGTEPCNVTDCDACEIRGLKEA